MIEVNKRESKLEMTGSLEELTTDIAQAIVSLHSIKSTLPEFKTDTLLDTVTKVALTAKFLYEDPNYQEVLRSADYKRFDVTNLKKVLGILKDDD